MGLLKAVVKTNKQEACKTIFHLKPVRDRHHDPTAHHRYESSVKSISVALRVFCGYRLPDPTAETAGEPKQVRLVGAYVGEP